jgi:hypothetical protein
LPLQDSTRFYLLPWSSADAHSSSYDDTWGNSNDRGIKSASQPVCRAFHFLSSGGSGERAATSSKTLNPAEAAPKSKKRPRRLM